MVLTILKLALVLGLGVFGAVRTYRGQYGTGIGALFLAAIIIGPGVIRAVEYRVRDIDAQLVLKGGVVEMRNRGPVAFQSGSTRNPYGGRIHRFRTVVETGTGPKDIGFSIWDVGTWRSPNYSAECNRTPGPGGLDELITSDVVFDKPVHARCRGTDAAQFIYASKVDDGPRTRIRCSKSDPTRNCAMTLFYGPYNIRAFMWEVPPSQWRAVRDHITTILDQSFTVAESN